MPCPAMMPVDQAGSTRLSWHPAPWGRELLVCRHAMAPAPAPAPAGRLAGSVLGHSQLQAGMFERASQPGGEPALASPPTSLDVGGGRPFGPRERLHLPHPACQGQCLTWLCLSVCDCRLRARWDRSRHRGRKGRVPHWDRYAPFPGSPMVVGPGTLVALPVLGWGVGYCLAVWWPQGVSVTPGTAWRGAAPPK